ncbi:FlhC family transcriptional regulator [Duganella vulcania]|uniref:Flagellar transcriptional regulator FlhC n=1 Tax=Duganella vulcania TaxID=2692166 RepID=A0A845GFK0_9BURK|nr:FlhC family transcriptional regulator [Duganella vulcania]MYM92721.1 hypothetical protein [Duganella vulcania]
MSAGLAKAVSARKGKVKRLEPVDLDDDLESGRREKVSALDEANQIRVAHDLIMLCARIAVVSHLTGLAPKKLRRLYREWTNKDPLPGHLPSNPCYYTEDLPKCLHSSVYLSLYRYYAQLNSDENYDAQLLITTYRAYLQHFNVVPENAPLDFNRAWAMVRAYRAGQVVSQGCRKCGCNYIVATTYSRQGCPICSIYSNSQCCDCKTPIRTGQGLLQVRGKRRCEKCQRQARIRRMTASRLSSSPRYAVFA